MGLTPGGGKLTAVPMADGGGADAADDDPPDEEDKGDDEDEDDVARGGATSDALVADDEPFGEAPNGVAGGVFFVGGD